MFKKVLVALDHSVLSQDTFDQAVAFAKATQAQLMLVHVLTPQEEGYPTSTLTTGMIEGVIPVEAASIYLDQLEAYKAKGLELLRSSANLAQQQGIEVETQQPLGDAGYGICDVARTWQADVIIVGRRSKAFLSKLFLGSVSNYVSHHAPCSVFIVHPPEPSEADAASPGATSSTD
ncbi:MAG: universal stress protein [Thermosynechococcaceae cyanobacterium]